MSKYAQAPNEEGFDHIKFRCCDCGLVHKMSLKIASDGSIAMAISRDNRATSASRRYKAGYLFNRKSPLKYFIKKKGGG